MPRTAATGAYAAPTNSWNPAVDNTAISSTDWNTLLADLATALSTASATTRALWPTAAQVQDGAFELLSAVSGVDTITATGPLSVSAYAKGQVFRFVSAGANTGAVTLNINSIGALAVKKLGTTALAAGDISSGQAVSVFHDGTNFQIIGATAAAAGTLSRMSNVFTRDISTSSGTQAITGVGFTPTAVIFLSAVGATARVSVGIDDCGSSGSGQSSIYDINGDSANNWQVSNVSSIALYNTSSDKYVGHITATGADGFTITWTKTGSPTGTATIFYLAMK